VYFDHFRGFQAFLVV